MKNSDRKKLKQLYRQVAIEVIGKKLVRMKPLTPAWMKLADLHRDLIYGNAISELKGI